MENNYTRLGVLTIENATKETTAPTATCWFTENDTEIPPITIDAYPDARFEYEIRGVLGTLTISENGEEVVLSPGWYATDGYFCDLTSDGKPELCLNMDHEAYA